MKDAWKDEEKPRPALEPAMVNTHTLADCTSDDTVRESFRDPTTMHVRLDSAFSGSIRLAGTAPEAAG